MAANNNKLIILVLLICLLPHAIFTPASAKDVDTKAYVESLCQKTPYQELCVRLMTPYVRSRAIQSPEDLALFVLKDSLKLAINATEFLLKDVERLRTLGFKDYALVSESMTRLIAVLNSLHRILSANIGDVGVSAKYSNNLQRLTSTALTDAETLVSKFQGRRLSKLEATIYGKVKNVEETTKNALAITKHYAANY